MAERSVVLDATYRALAHPARRELLGLLRGGEARVTDLARAFPVSLASTSKHIRVLESAGLITRRVHGRDHLISLEPRRLAQAGAWIEGYRSFWESRLDKLGEALQGGGPTQRTDDKEEP